MGTQSSVYSGHIFCNTINIVFFTSVNSHLIFSNGNGLEGKSTLRDARGWSHQQQSIQIERGGCLRCSRWKVRSDVCVRDWKASHGLACSCSNPRLRYKAVRQISERDRRFLQTMHARRLHHGPYRRLPTRRQLSDPTHRHHGKREDHKQGEDVGEWVQGRPSCPEQQSSRSDAIY